MAWSQVLTKLVSVALCLQCLQCLQVAGGAAEDVCCETKLNASETETGCCEAKWQMHCCRRNSQTTRLETCCFGETRVAAAGRFTHGLEYNLYNGVFWFNVLIFVALLMLTAMTLLWCCRSVCNYYKRASVPYDGGCCGRPHPIIREHPTRYGAVIGTGQANQVRSGFGLAPPFPGKPQPAHGHVTVQVHTNPYARCDYTPSYYHPTKESQNYQQI